MQVLDETTVHAEEIDNFGHLNVRHYLVRLYRANQQIMGRIGLDRDARRAMGAVLGRAESFTRYHREQHLGARLEVVGGVVDLGPTTIRTYCEIRNAETGEAAATFLSGFVLEDAATRAPLAWPAGAGERAGALALTTPDHGGPRSLSQGPPKLDLTYDAVLERVGANGDGMSGVAAERTIAPADCDAFGFFSDGGELLQGAARARTAEGRNADTPVHVDATGRRFGWAVLEQRMLQFSRPRVGDSLRSIGAVIRLDRKTQQTRRWTFDRASGRVVALDDTVTIALDLGARRAIEIPPEVRGELEARYAPEFV